MSCIWILTVLAPLTSEPNNDFFFLFLNSGSQILLAQTSTTQILLSRHISQSSFVSSNKNDEKDLDNNDNSVGKDVGKGVGGAKEDYIDENPELQKILRDLYSEPETANGKFTKIWFRIANPTKQIPSRF